MALNAIIIDKRPETKFTEHRDKTPIYEPRGVDHTSGTLSKAVSSGIGFANRPKLPGGQLDLPSQSSIGVGTASQGGGNKIQFESLH